MTTSGTTTYNLTTVEIIREALELLGVVAIGQSIEAEDYSTCLRTLNMMVKSWQNQDIFMTHEKNATLFLEPKTTKYKLGGSSPSRAGDGDIIETKVSTAAVATDTTLNVGDTTGMTALDKIGVEMTDGTMHWTTVASITDSNTLELTVALTEDVDSGAMVFAYTNQMGRPLKIISAHLRTSGGTDAELIVQQQDRQLNEINGLRYRGISNKGSVGTSLMFFQDKQNDYMNLYIYPTGNTVAERIKLTYYRVIEDFSSSTDNADLPQSWMTALAQNLAAQVAPKYGKEEKAAAAIAPMAATSLKIALESNKGQSKFSILPSDYR